MRLIALPGIVNDQIVSMYKTFLDMVGFGYYIADAHQSVSQHNTTQSKALRRNPNESPPFP